MLRFRSRRFAMLLILLLTLSMALQGLGTAAFAEDEVFTEPVLDEVQVLDEEPVEVDGGHHHTTEAPTTEPPYDPGDGTSEQGIVPDYNSGNYNNGVSFEPSSGWKSYDGIKFRFSSDKKYVEWQSVTKCVLKVYVKGSNGYFEYIYDGSLSADKKLRAPNTKKGNIPDISHVIFKTGPCPTTEPETTQPDTTQPDTTQPDTTQPDTTQPDTTQPDTTQPDTTQPDTTQPDTTQPDTTQPDTTQPDTTQPDTTQPDTTQPDTTQPDTTQPDTTQEDTTEVSTDPESTTEPATNPPNNPRNRNRTTTVETTLPTEPVPLAVPVIEPEPVIEEEPVIIEEVVPLGVPVLPKTGELPVELFYGLGGVITALGAFLRKK